MGSKDPFANLDFSGGTNSWFDLWHTHIDWDGKGNKSWKQREIYLNQLVDLFNRISDKMVGYPRPYQVWIEIWEDDSSEDSIYIHTPNPNADNFPVKINQSENVGFPNENLKFFLEKQPLSAICQSINGSNVVYVFDPLIGVRLSE